MAQPADFSTRPSVNDLPTTVGSTTGTGSDDTAKKRPQALAVDPSKAEIDRLMSECYSSGTLDAKTYSHLSFWSSTTIKVSKCATKIGIFAVVAILGSLTAFAFYHRKAE